MRAWPDSNARVNASLNALKHSFLMTGRHNSMLHANTSLPVVVVLGTGGTIASSAAVATQLSDYAVGRAVGALIDAVPELQALAHFEYEQVANIESYHIDDEVLLKLAQRVNHWLAKPEVTAVVITHGTDTLEETAYFLNLVVQSDKPVVLVGAMRPATAISADGPLNLFHAVVVAVNPESVGQGVLVVMNDRILAARHVLKGHTTNVDAFVVPEQGCLGSVSGRIVHYSNRITARHTFQSELHIDQTLATLPHVAIVYDYQGAGLYMYQAALQAGAEGIVLAGTGNGSLSGVAQSGAELACAQQAAFVRATRVAQGSVKPSQKDTEYGCVAAQSLNPQKARVLLRLALLKTRNREILQRMFNEY